MVAIGGAAGWEWAPALANAVTVSNSSSTDPTTRSEPHTLWLQNLAIAIEVLMIVLSTVVCSLRAFIRTKTKNLGWGMLIDWIAKCPALPVTSPPSPSTKTNS
jgi:hypothetical protein